MWWSCDVSQVPSIQPTFVNLTFSSYFINFACWHTSTYVLCFGGWLKDTQKESINCWWHIWLFPKQKLVFLFQFFDRAIPGFFLYLNLLRHIELTDFLHILSPNRFYLVLHHKVKLLNFFLSLLSRHNYFSINPIVLFLALIFQ